jgi:hypothetical protein
MVKDFLPCSDPRILAVLERVEMLRLVNECMIGRATSLRGMKLRQLIAEDLFPAPDVRVGSKRWCWNLDTLLAWMRDQELARRSNDRCRWLHDAAGGTANSLHN